MSDFKLMNSSEAYELLYGKYEMEDDSDPMIRPYSEKEGWVVQMGEDSYTNNMPDAPYEDAKLLAHARRALYTIAKMGKPRIIRTVEELEALDPDTLVGTHGEIVSTTFGAGHILATDYLDDLMFPMVIVATGEQVRAAREAMEQEHGR